MKTCPVIAVLLTAALLGSNGYWLYVVADNAVSASYREDAFVQQDAALGELMAITPRLAGTMGRKEVEALAAAATGETPFEKEGVVWVGQLGFMFDATERLHRIRTAHEID